MTEKMRKNVEIRKNLAFLDIYACIRLTYGVYSFLRDFVRVAKKSEIAAY